MCRKNQLWGLLFVTFGFGLLLGMLLESGFLCGCLGLGLIVGGLFVLQRK